MNASLFLTRSHLSPNLCYHILLHVLLSKLPNPVTSLPSHVTSMRQCAKFHRNRQIVGQKVGRLNLHLLNLLSPRSTRSSSLVTLARPSTSSSLRITDRSSRRLWNQLPASPRQPRTNLCSTTPALYLQPPTTPNVFDKQSTNFYTANPPLLPSTSPRGANCRQRLFFSQAKYPNCVFLSFHSCFGIRNPQDPVQL